MPGFSEKHRCAPELSPAGFLQRHDLINYPLRSIPVLRADLRDVLIDRHAIEGSGIIKRHILILTRAINQVV